MLSNTFTVPWSSNTIIMFTWKYVYGVGHHLKKWKYWKLPSLFAAWLFLTVHTKSHNMKAFVILSHSWSPFLSLTYLYEKNELLWVSGVFSGVFSWENNYPQITYANHMTMTTSEQFYSWPDYCKTKENVNIMLLDLYLYPFYSVHANEFTWHWL